jgi:hypothetical protein
MLPTICKIYCQVEVKIIAEIYNITIADIVLLDRKLYIEHPIDFGFCNEWTSKVLL